MTRVHWFSLAAMVSYVLAWWSGAILFLILGLCFTAATVIHMTERRQ